MRARIVIADDEAIIRMGLRAMLEEQGYTVVGEAADGRRALDLVQKLRPDLVFLDIKMAGMDGLEAADELARTHRVPVVLLTAYGDRAFVERGRQAGVMAYLMKPVREEDLAPAIEIALGRFHDLRALGGRIEALEGTLETRKLVERAKGALMERLRLTESEAYLRIQRAGRRTRRSMGDVARAVLEGDDLDEGRGSG